MAWKEIFKEGMKERRRRKSLRSGRKQLQDKQETFNGLLTALGRKAWETRVAGDAFPELRASLGETEKTVKTLREQTSELERKKQQAESDKKDALARLDSRQKELAENKDAADRRLQGQKSALQAAQNEARQAKSRLEAICRERDLLAGRAADPAASEAEKADGTAKIAALAREAQEQEAINGEKEETGRDLGEKIVPLEREADRLRKEIDELRAEQKKAASDADKRISGLADELKLIAGKLKEAEKTQDGNFRRLGEALAATSSAMDPEIAREAAAVQGAKAEMDGIQSLLGGLERQKDQGQVSAYKKMMALLIGGAVLVAAILALLLFLLAPGKRQTPARGLSGPLGAGIKGLDTLARQMQEGQGGEDGEGEETPERPIIAADEGALRAILPVGGGWRQQNPYYSRGKFRQFATASLQADYLADDGRSLQVQVTDAGSAAALLAPLKALFALNLRIDDENATQRVSSVNGIPVLERFNKHDQEATLGIIIKDRYLIELKTKAAKGLDLLRDFAARLDLSKLQS